ncbi:TIGR01777 family oxidoreductase [Paenibacillus sp. GCM10012307]|uniref:TIGR01777 family oxidoreductase n=1 Tax=Paenibacillus roseus TaxID=2798579 RepID=A0A934J6S7_9BACL|nr:TIGR01777 family oxidoreductase [Paenibacillus roseus]MBJ6361432.1 TIGR01777 family oxidoreductase [Paenibacillus roseus]
MRIAVAGGSGFIGHALVQHFLGRGDEVWIITRSTGRVEQQHPKLHVISWEDLSSKPERLEGIHAIINLSGESINQRWTADAKDRIIKSRLVAAERISKLIRSLQRKPDVVINASGISAYGNSETATFDEDSPEIVSDFLSSVVEKWEAAADSIGAKRLVKLRVGIVIGTDGGAFPKMALPYRMFAGGKIGSGKQWLSWIHVDDIVRLIAFCIDHDEIKGAVNASAPEPVTNDDFGRALGKAMGRPHWMPVPGAMLKLIFGELAVLLLEGQRVIPKRTLDAGFQFRFPTIQSAMNDLVGTK